MSLYKRGGVWWITVTVNGKRVRCSSRTHDRKRAQKLHDEIRADAWKKKSGKSFFDVAEDWLAAEQRDPSDAYRLKKLKTLYRDRQVSSVTAESLEAVIPNSSAGTFNRYINLVLAVLNYAGHPVKFRRRETVPSRIRWLTPKEWEKLERELPCHQRQMARFALATGLRQRNVFELEWSQVDMRRKLAWVHADQTKSGNAIRVPLSPAAMAVLTAQKGLHEDFVFPFDGHPVSEIKTAFKSALTRAKITNFRWHDLRHTWATWHLANGTPLEVLKELGGWSDLRMVMRYAHLADDFVAQYAGNSRAPESQSRSQRKAK